LEFVLYTILIAFLYIFSGIGLCFLLGPKILEKYSLYLSPFVGLAYLSYFSWFFFEYSPWGTNDYAGLLLIPPLFFLILAVIIKKDRIVSIFFPFKKENLSLIFLCIMIFSAISYPYYTKVEGISNTITLGNGDIGDYAATSKYIMLSSNLQSSIPYVSEASLRFSDMLQTYYFSAFLSSAIPSSVLNLQSFQIQNLIIFLFFVFSLPIIYLIGIEFFDYTKKIALTIILLIGINVHLLFIMYDGFLAQIIGLGFFLGLILTTFYPILKFNKFSETSTFLPINILFCFGLLMSYNALLPLFLIPTILFIGTYFIHSRSKPFLVQSISYLLLTFFITFLISPLSFRNRVISLITLNNSAVGWNLPILTPDWIFGLIVNNFFSLQQQEPTILRILLSLPIVLLILFSFYHLFKIERKLFYLFGSFFSFVTIFYFYLIIKEYLSPDYTGEGYKAYKLITYFVPIIILTGLFYFKDFHIESFSKNFRKEIPVLIFLLLLIIWNIGVAFVFISQSPNRFELIPESTIDLQNISRFENVTSINILEPPSWNQMWIYYFLFDKKLVYLKYSFYYPASPQIGDWTLINTKNLSMNSILNSSDSSSIVKLNSDYTLKKNYL
jgi:hypothetical protein